MANLMITDVRAILTAPGGARLIAVKVETSEPGLYGVGCATFTQRHQAVRSAVVEFLKPFLVGKDPSRIEDIHHTARVNSYWRNGPVLNNALSGVDMALWDIKGKQAGMPLYNLLGGRCRDCVPVYCHVDGSSLGQVEERVAQRLEQGFRYIRCQFGGYGGGTVQPFSEGSGSAGNYFDPRRYCRETIAMFAHLRSAVSPEVELLHDVHERLAPIDAVGLSRDLEQFRLFFLEDLLPPEQADWFAMVRRVCTTPLAMGELFTNPAEWMPLVSGRLIDFIRCHISAIGGITPALKLAHLCEAFGIRTAWHGPGDVSPIGHAAQAHLDISSRNFGIQEAAGFSDAHREVFPGCPEITSGAISVSDSPGIGVDIDEAAAAKYRCPDGVPEWTTVRIPDGTAVYP